MAFFIWKDEFSVKVGQLDEQHKRLFSMLRDVYEKMMEYKGKESIASVLSGIVSYTMTHLADEERLMQTYGYPEYAAHKLAHDNLKAQVQDYLDREQRGERVDLIDVALFLKNWLFSHIAEVDKRYASFFNAQGLN